MLNIYEFFEKRPLFLQLSVQTSEGVFKKFLIYGGCKKPFPVQTSREIKIIF